MKFCYVSLSMRSCEKLVDNKKEVLKRANTSMRFSDLPLLLIDNTRYQFLAVFHNSHRSQKVVYEKESSTTKSCQKNLVLCVYGLKFVSIVTAKVCLFIPTFQTEMLPQEKLGNFRTFLSMSDS